jgi:peptide/nickel transport system substrate-binding protein
MDEFDAPVLFHHDESMPPVEPGTFGFGGGWSRRSVLLGGAGAGLAALLAACGGDNKGATPTTAAAATTAAPATTAGAGSSSSSGAAATTATSAAARTDGKTQTVTIGVPSVQEGFVDPLWAVGGLIFPLMWAITDFLYMPNQDGKFVPTLATGFDLSADGLTWTFKLRDGVKNHDGSPFTANDVKTSVDRVVSGPQAAQFTHLANFKSYVTTATVVDPLTVAVTTSKPFATCVVDMVPPIATDYYNKVGDAAFKWPTASPAPPLRA